MAWRDDGRFFSGGARGCSWRWWEWLSRACIGGGGWGGGGGGGRGGWGGGVFGGGFGGGWGGGGGGGARGVRGVERLYGLEALPRWEGLLATRLPAGARIEGPVGRVVDELARAVGLPVKPA